MPDEKDLFDSNCEIKIKIYWKEYVKNPSSLLEKIYMIRQVIK